MSVSQIPNLPAATGLTGAEQLEAVQAGASVRLTSAQIAALSPSGPPGPPGPPGPSGDTTSVDTVAVLQGTSFPAVVHGVSILGYYSIGTGAFSVRRVASQPSHPWKFRSLDRYLPNGSTSDTNGGWWEGYPWPDGTYVDFEAFGAVADGVTDNLAVFNNAKAYIASLPRPIELHVGPGNFYFSQGLSITSKMIIRGTAPAWAGVFPSTWFYFAYGYNGITVTSSGAAGSCFYNLLVTTNNISRAAPWNAKDPYSGFIASYRVVVENCLFLNWPLYGCWISSNDGSHSGNANNWRVSSCYFPYNGHAGFRVSGSDANAGLCEFCSTIECPGYGFQDDSFLGNTYNACHTEQCNIPSIAVIYNLAPFVIYGGEYYKIWQQDPLITQTNLTDAQTTPPNPASTIWYHIGTAASVGANTTNTVTWGQCLYNGTVYNVVGGQEAMMWSSQPDTTPAVWTSAGAAVPGNIYITWYSGIAPYIYGAPYAARSTNATSAFTGCYQEGSQGSSYDVGGSVWLACPGVTQYWDSAGPTISGRDWAGPGKGNLVINSGVQTQIVKTNGSTQNVAVNNRTSGSVLSWSTTDYSDPGDIYTFWRTSASTWGLSVNYGASFLDIYTPESTRPNGIRIANLYLSNQSSGNLWVNDLPNNGTHSVGDICLNTTFGSSAVMYRCTAGGSPGTYETIYGSKVPFLGVTTYGGLPAANAVPNGTSAIIVDCNSNTLGATAAAGGSNRVRVNSDTTNWIIG